MSASEQMDCTITFTIIRHPVPMLVCSSYWDVIWDVIWEPIYIYRYIYRYIDDVVFQPRCFNQGVPGRSRQALDRCVSWPGSAFAPVPARPMRRRALTPRCNGQWSASGPRRGDSNEGGWMDSEWKWKSSEVVTCSNESEKSERNQRSQRSQE